MSILLLYTFIWIFADSGKLLFFLLFEKRGYRGTREVAGVEQRGVPSMLFRRAPPAILHQNSHFTVDVAAEKLIDDLDFDHSSFVSAMSPEKEDKAQESALQSKGMFLRIILFTLLI